MGTPVRLGRPALNSEGPAVKQRLNQREYKQQHAADPEVKGIKRDKSFGEIEDKPTAKQGDQTKNRRRGVTLEPETFLQKGNHRLQHRNTASNGRNKEHKKPEKTKELAHQGGSRHEGKYVRQRFKTECKGSLLTNGRPKKNKRCGDRDQTTKDDFKKFVHAAAGQAAEDDVVVLPQVTCIVDDNPKAN